MLDIIILKEDTQENNSVLAKVIEVLYNDDKDYFWTV